MAGKIHCLIITGILLLTMWCVFHNGADLSGCSTTSTVQRMQQQPSHAWQGCLRLDKPPLKHGNKDNEHPDKEGEQYRYFLHITDMHVDLGYTPGTTVKSACHRKRGETFQQEQLQETLTTTRPRKHHRVGRLGAPFEHCDAPLELAQQTIDWVARHWKDKLDFVIWTGDNSRHDWDRKESRRRNQILQLNQKVTSLIAESLPNTPIIPCLGNNDVYPHNRIVDYDEILPFFENLWRSWIPKSERNKFLQGGYFITDIGKNIRVVSLNTMFFIKKNKSVKSCRKNNGPAKDHIHWLEQTLAQAEKDHKRVLIMGHVPPSPRDYRNSCFTEYLRISADYGHVIAGHFYGHLNMDHFLLYDSQQFIGNSKKSSPATTLLEADDDDGQLIHVTRNIERYVDWLRGMYQSIEAPKDTEEEEDEDTTPSPGDSDNNLVAIQVSPSVLPVYYPTVRIYRYTDSFQSGNLLGYSQYYANITRWELEHPPEDPLEYELEYTTENDYDLDNLSPKSLFKFAKYMIEGDSDNMWNAYTRNMFVRTQNETFPIDDDDDDDDDDDY
ncbi:Metallo-dependent phosphatase-like protein [Zychaea mexicana]|uniref:Metallo-dependent phosphatase-like protein n=1 Tax=Zychaea mexicana TaxID=64656 RepID=UPI0022FEB876|nr:Metallo-dependent phosphatase-like protein [Zychaea mexicana]KAI9496475.1 Metallo-dependent phosphatase-like protein [Zychaea mexicana]